uniref:Uncharacterized protein n=1 Tax=Alexandrium monilatum TaxID=311494 RepID=A0A7S4VKV6_9DINO
MAQGWPQFPSRCSYPPALVHLRPAPKMARRGSLIALSALLLAAWIAGPAFLPPASRSPAPPRWAAVSGEVPLVSVFGAAVPLALAEPAFAKEGDGSISGTEWAGYVTIALVIFVFVNAAKAQSEGK